MLELTGVAPLFDLVGWLYWAMAIGALAAAIRYPETTRRRVAWSVVAVVGFSILPVLSTVHAFQRRAYAEAAWAHFKKRCAENAGEKIYSVHHGVKSVLVTKMLPPATDRDLRDQYWMGDPYSNATPSPNRGVYAALMLVGPRLSREKGGQPEVGLEFVEVRDASEDALPYAQIISAEKAPFYRRIPVKAAESMFGVAWTDISTDEDRKYWVAGSRLEVRHLDTGKVVAERTGYLFEAGLGSGAGNRMSWLVSRRPSSTCPALASGDYEDRWFVLKALRQE